MWVRSIPVEYALLKTLVRLITAEAVLLHDSPPYSHSWLPRISYARDGVTKRRPSN